MGTIASRYFDDVRRGFALGAPPEIDVVAALLVQCVEQGRTVYTFGNGASAALAAHMACDLGKGSASDLGQPATSSPLTRRLRIVSLPDNAALTTAYGNDLAFDSVFVEPLKNLLRAGDVVIAISGSGGSPNVLRALEYARAAGATTVGFTGRMTTAALLAERCDIVLSAPFEVIEQIEDFHVSAMHAIALTMRAALGTAPAGWER